MVVDPDIVNQAVKTSVGLFNVFADEDIGVVFADSAGPRLGGVQFAVNIELPDAAVVNRGQVMPFVGVDRSEAFTPSLRFQSLTEK